MSTTTEINWDDLPVHTRAELLRAGIPFPSETDAERRCRIKAALGIFDDEDLCALAGVSQDTLTKKRVDGTGPRPIRVMRAIFYSAEDVKDWMLRHRDAPVPSAAKSR